MLLLEHLLVGLCFFGLVRLSCRLLSFWTSWDVKSCCVIYLEKLYNRYIKLVLKFKTYIKIIFDHLNGSDILWWGGLARDSSIWFSPLDGLNLLVLRFLFCDFELLNYTAPARDVYIWLVCFPGWRLLFVWVFLVQANQVDDISLLLGKLTLLLLSTRLFLSFQWFFRNFSRALIIAIVQ